ncbi:TTF-type domain-containing protein [Citrus sinensis]|uniref:TTF-type domain-containing protein n=1 Tax=Citrus sinensis TaxID=2711 RepID=A0ACB8N3E9_CITSI|nr:TTF-type domain-containing protein [Citrus sinensis]
MRENDVEVNLLNLPMDPGLRHPISYYNVNIQDQVRRQYLQNGPCQPKTHNFPLRHFGKQSRRFNSSWFDKYGNWLEYSIAKDAAFCLCCYLFKPEIGEQAGGESFTKHGFTNWKKPKRLRVHVGCSNSVHNDAWRSCQDLMKQEQHIQTMYSRHSNQTRSEYRARLQASIDCSSNRGNFLELLKFLADHNEDIKAVTLENAPSFFKVTCPDTQKDIVSACAIETTNAIIREMGDAFFSILVDESRDVSIKEQMAIVLRYVNISGQVVERFIGIEQVGSTTAQSLKEAIDRIFSRHGLSMSRVRGQGYDGASNMQGEFNGLKTIILRENECAYYIHCFAHQLQLALIVVAKNHIQIESFFAIIANVVNVVGASSKRCDALREKHAEEVVKALNLRDLSSGQGLNQETTLKRCGDIRWGSHYNTLLSIINMFSAVISVLEMIIDDGPKSGQRGEAKNLLELMLSFNFVFCLHLMRNILGATDELSQALQRKDQDIVNAMNLVRLCKLQLQTMRQSGWNSLIDEVTFFCAKHDIDMPNMDDMFVDRGRSRRKAQEITNLHRYRVELYYAVLDMQLQELNSRFNETNTELLLCLACLSPNDLFSAFNKQKLLRLAQLYPNEFSTIDIMALEIQLDTYILDMRTSGEFSELKDIGDLAKRMVETKRHNVYPLVYLLITLALTLPVATASVERAFSAMNILKNQLRNRMGEQWMNDSLVVYIEKDLFNNIDNEVVMQRYQCMKIRKGQL